MRKQKESLVQKIVLKYKDGTEKKDLATVIWGVMNMADEMGMFDNIE